MVMVSGQSIRQLREAIAGAIGATYAFWSAVNELNKLNSGALK
jgi:hypothetical protein